MQADTSVNWTTLQQPATPHGNLGWNARLAMDKHHAGNAGVRLHETWAWKYLLDVQELLYAIRGVLPPNTRVLDPAKRGDL